MNINRRFPGKRVLITGAGCGLGRALCLEFAARGWQIAVTDVDQNRIRETAALVEQSGGRALVMRLDVTRPDDFVRALKTVKEQWGGIDVLVNNAGVAAAGLMERIPLDRWDWIVGINLKGIIHGCRAFIPLFKEQRGGHIVNVASSAGIASLAEMSSYNVSKAGAISLSETLKIELAGHNIGVSAVCPTFFRTNLMDQFSSPDERQRLLAERMFQKSRTSAEKIARLIIRSVGRNRFYVVTPIDGRVVWFFKRHFPEAYMKALAWSYRTGMFDRYTGLKGDAKGGAIQ